MSLFSRRSKKTADHTDVERLWASVSAANERTRAAQEKAKADKADLIARLSTRYYAASALVAADHAAGIVGSSGHQIGVMCGLIDALAEATGIDQIVVGYRMENGIPVTQNWVCTDDAPHGATPDMRLLHDGIRESWTERLDTLHREALKATGHPMYQVLYGTHAVV